ncbi:MAG: 2-C-methyl-D-erythritol 2,4-cyclodiphosphate synthase [Prevotellaceae bacterium]|jgi:ygbB family|nr:2-C-methyl-D-erythritol 2,4-cyclodiphosphate synthase [Prevotellaceae bacterium]
MNIRVGYGYDVHRLVEGRDLWLGGVHIEHTLGLLGHSDADVLIHAICDALLGAANLRDIGYHFPDTAPEYKGADSKVLLSRTVDLLAQHGYRVGNVDCTVCAERPKINPHIDAMKAVLAPLLRVDLDAVSLKATTSERMGFVGREEGMAAHAVALIERV